jgi:hypothetical protein
MDATGVGNELREVLQAADNILAVPPDAIVSAIEAKNMRLGPPLALNYATLSVGAVVVDWPDLKVALGDVAARQGWRLSSHVQQAQGGGHRGRCGCAHPGCTWNLPLAKVRGELKVVITDGLCLDHNHALAKVIDLPEGYEPLGHGPALRRDKEVQMTFAEMEFARQQARYIKRPFRLAAALKDEALRKGLGNVDYCRRMVGRIIQNVNDVSGVNGDQLQELLEVGMNIRNQGEDT